MDVRCNRCGTEYEFDDALISERGTTVKCTHCGHQFKVFGSRSEKGVPERWTVRTSDGREIVYSDLRELQSDILDRRLSALDRLSRGNQAPRQLGTIAELAQFFKADGKLGQSTKPPLAADPLSQAGPHRSTDAPDSSTAPLGVARDVLEPAPASKRIGAKEAAQPNQSTVDAPSVDAPSSEAKSAEETSESGEEEGTTPSGVAPTRLGGFEATPNAGKVLPRSAAAEQANEKKEQANENRSVAASAGASARDPSSPFGSSPLASAPLRSSPSNPRHYLPEELTGPPPSVGRRSLRSSDELTGNPPSVGRRHLRSGNEANGLPAPVSRRKSYEELSASPPSVSRRNLRSYDELSGTPPSVSRRSQRSYEDLMGLAAVGRRASSRWIAALVVLALIALFMLTVGRRYLPESVTAGRSGEGARSHRVAELLREGQRLLDDGEFEGASEPLLRASALSEKDPAVLAALARLATMRADVLWLRLRLLDPKLSELLQSTRKELGKRVGKARTAVDAAFAVAPEDIVVIRARVDALRLSGEATEAREWIRPIAANASDPHNAYVLAALDLADASPSWASAIDRLRTAANGERSPGRAQAALIYALARSGRIADAEAELGRLDSGTHGALLVDELRAFLKRSAGGGAGGENNKSGVPTPGGSAAPAKAAQARGEK